MLKIQAIAPSGKINKEKFELGMKHLSELLDCEFSYQINVFQEFRGMAGSDENRLNDFNKALNSDHIDIIWAIRGGFGATRVLPKLEHKNTISNKVLIGYSDITAYQWYCYKYYNMKSISGQMIQVDFIDTTDKSEDYDKLFSLIKNECSCFEMPTGVKFENWENKVEGKMLGGCLAIISKLMGTAFVPDLKDHILFFEDIDEPIYRIDGYLSHLYNSGVFENVAAVIFGQFTAPKECNHEEFNRDLENVLAEYRELIHKPCIWNFPIGHINHIFPLPIGYDATITKDQLEFRK